MAKLAEPFKTAYQKVKGLQKHKRYIGAFIFGSVVRGEHGKDSDMDVIVAVDMDNDCTEINHPIIKGLKLDLSFRSLKQIKEMDDEVVKKGKRIPMIAESIIVFDKTSLPLRGKTGKLTKLKNKFLKYKREKAKKSEHQFMQFMLYHADSKAKRNLKDDPATAMLALGININEILEFHYKLNGKWWVSNKRILRDLRDWDPPLALLLEKFATATSVLKKYSFWEKILDHVAIPMGGRKEIGNINCNCKVCKVDLNLLQ